jgi:hypothetical protein
MRLNGDNTVYGPKSSIRLTVDGKEIDVLALKRPRDMAPVRAARSR